MKILLPIILLATAATAHADAVRIQINGPDGQPVAGALVRVQESSGSWIEPKYETPRDLTSDENGVVNWESKFSLARKSDDGSGRINRALARVEAPAVAAIGGAVLKAGDNVIALRNATTLQGVVREENQQPLADARVRVTSLFLPGKDPEWEFLSLKGDLAIETQSDAQGNWRLDNLPDGATARIEVEAPGFRKLEFSAPILPGALPIFLRRGATIKGRILRPDGSGAAGVQFFAGDAWNQPRTDANGRFEVSGIEPGGVTLQITSGGEKLPFILPYKSVQGLQAGEVRDVGDWKGDIGVRVRGRVTDGAGQPIAGASISVWGAGNGSGLADAKGAFDFVAQKGASMSTVSASGYVSKQSPNVPDAKNGVVDLGTITLKRGQKIEGVLKNQAGSPTPNIYLRATRNGNDVGGAYSNAKGEFAFDGLENGPYLIKSYDGKIVSGERFVMTATGNQPLAVVIEGRAPDAQIQGVPLQVRIVDENGLAVAGAQVALKLERGQSYSEFAFVSDDKGALNGDIRGAGEKLKITEVFRPGYSAGANSLKLENGAWRGEIRLQARGQALRGRVVDGAAKPRAGVAVALASGFDLPVATGENGEFALPDAPQVGSTILVSDGDGLASLKVEKANQKIEIVLPVAATSPDKAALADQIAPRAWWESWNLLDNWDDFGAARMETLVLQNRRDANDSWAWNQFLEMLARREPARFVARESELRANNTNNNDEPFDNAARLARAVAGSQAQKIDVRNWLAAEQKIKRETTAENVSALLTRTEIAAGLGDETQTQLWLDYAAQIGDYVPDRANNSWQWGDTLAQIAPDAAPKFVENWTPAAQMQLLISALTASAARNDAEAARASWEQIQKSALAAETAPPDDKTRVEGFIVKPSDVLRQARGEYAQLLSRTDPRAAFELAKDLSTEDFERVQTMPIIGKNAAQLGQFEVARLALKASFESNLSNTNFGADAAQTAATFDEKLADELFARLYASSRPSANDDARAQSSLSDYAAARADKWPGETRVLIEREWPIRLEDAQKPRDPDDNNYDDGDQTTITLVGTMARVAPARAIEIAEQLPERKQLRAKAFAEILKQLLAK